MSEKHYTATVHEDEYGDMVLPLDPDMLKELGWEPGDRLVWKDDGEGKFIVTKKIDETEWVLVEAVSTFRMRYMVEVPKGKAEWALDTVTMEKAKEFSQAHVAENIVSHRVVTEEQIIDLCDIDNHYCSEWSDDKKMEVFCTHIGEEVNLN